ncbi:MAG: hypothetical protein Q7R97_02940 [Candidatus Daviesbacteria bacterium]|nr:hypothetical protein [Candidatus Daviesbacteria bacterium]
MGANTKNFRQSKRSLSGSQGAQNYAKINRMGSWYGKISNLVTRRGKGGVSV